MTNEEIDHIFSYQRPDDSQIPRFAAIREAAKNLAKTINANCPNPNSPTTATAIAHARTAMLWGCAAIACESKPSDTVKSRAAAEEFNEPNDLRS